MKTLCRLVATIQSATQPTKLSTRATPFVIFMLSVTHPNLPYNSRRPESCITDLNPMLPVSDRMRTLFHHLGGCADAPCLEASMWIMHAAFMADHNLSEWECERLLYSVMRGMAVAAPLCVKEDAPSGSSSFPHMCCFEYEEKGRHDQPGLRINEGDVVDDQTATLGSIVFDLMSVLNTIRQSDIDMDNPLCPRVHNAMHQVCMVVSRLYDVILLSHICAHTPGCCKPCSTATPDTQPSQAFMVFRMQPMDVASQNTCTSLCFTHQDGPDAALANALVPVSLDDNCAPSNPTHSLELALMPSILRMQQVLSSIVCSKRLGRSARRAVQDVLVNHWSLYLHHLQPDAQPPDPLAADFWQPLTKSQWNALQAFTRKALDMAKSPSHRDNLAQCLERRAALTTQQLEWMTDIMHGWEVMLRNFLEAMSVGAVGAYQHAYMSAMVTPSLWCHSHRFSVSDREWVYDQEVAAYMARCIELGRRWQPLQHIYGISADLWEKEFSNFASNMLDANCQLADCCPPVLGVVGDNNPPLHGTWMLRLRVYNPVAHQTHDVDVPLNVALRLAKPKVYAYFQHVKNMEVPRSLKNVWGSHRLRSLGHG